MGTVDELIALHSDGDKWNQSHLHVGDSSIPKEEPKLITV